MIPDHHFDDYQNRRVLVMGLGSFGGGLGAVKFLVQRGASVTVTDLRPREKLEESLQELKETPPDRLVLGEHQESDFLAADLLVVNPAVKRDNPFLNAARDAGVPTTSEMNLFWKWNRAPVVAVTGSNGKSTTTALIHSILSHTAQRQSGRKAWLGGNIGTSLLPMVDQIQANDLVVLELSSFQLADLDRLQVSPHVAVVTNFAPNHLDWHPNLDDYRHAKQTLLRWQSDQDTAVLNADDLDVRGWPVRGRRLEFGIHDAKSSGVFLDGRNIVVRRESRVVRWPLADWLKLPGQHNFANAMAAIAATNSVGATETDAKAGIETYQPLPHRLQFVAEACGRRFFNDSLATTPESTEVALSAFDAPIVLLAGGYDKHVDLSRMAAAIARNVKSVALMGQTAQQLGHLIRDNPAATCEVSPPQESFAASFEWAIAHSSPGDVILLSPGCASYDWFRNFAERGAKFIEFVRQYERTPQKENL
jgi:UDP-N-acetylmuramoylalanine--D-glutamate ligase